MSLFVHALAFLPAVAVAIVAVAAYADRRETIALNALRTFDEEAELHTEAIVSV